MLKVFVTLLAASILGGCAITPAYSSYSPPRGGYYYSPAPTYYQPAPVYYAPAPYFSFSWRSGHGHRHWH